jgi:hypothetical protein
MEDHKAASHVLAALADTGQSKEDLDMGNTLQDLRNTTGLYFFNDYTKLSEEELYAAIMSARVLIAVEWNRIFVMFCMMLVAYIVFIGFVIAFVTVTHFCEYKGWTVRRRFLPGKET